MSKQRKIEDVLKKTADGQLFLTGDDLLSELIEQYSSHEELPSEDKSSALPADFKTLLSLSGARRKKQSS